MMKHGIRRISVEEICRAAGISKMTFYKYFPNKKALSEVVLEDFVKNLEAEAEAIRASDRTYPEKFKALIRMKIEQMAGMSWDFLRDLQGGQMVEWREKLQSYNEKNTRIFLEEFKAKQAAGEIHPNVRVETFLDIANRMRPWISDESFTRRYPSVEAMVNEIMDFLVYGFLGRAGEEGR